MRLQLCLLLFFASSFLVVAQEAKQDSVVALLYQTAMNSTSDTVKANSYLDIADFYKYQNQDSTLFYVALAESAIKDAHYPKLLSKIASYRAGVHFLRGEYKDVINIAQRGLSYIGENPELAKNQADLLRVIGIAYGASGNYGLSLKHFLETKQIYEKIGDFESVRTSLNNVGVIYLKLDDFEKALDIFLELDEISPLDDPSRITIPVNLGFIYYELNELDKAEQQLQKVLNEKGDIDTRAYGLSNFKLGEIYIKQQKLDLAKQSFNASIQVYDELKNELEKVQSFNGLAKVFLLEGSFSRALEYGRQALTIAKEYEGLPEKKISLETLYLIEKMKGNYVSALSYHEQFLEVLDSLENSEVTAEISRLTTEYEFYQLENELLIQQREQEIKNQAQINRQRLFLIGILVILLFAALLIFFMYRSNSQKKITNKLLSAKNSEIEDKARKLEQSNNVKNRLFSILAHDLRGPLSSLSGVISLIEMNVTSKKDLESLLPEVDRRFKYTSTLLHNLLQWSQSQMDGYKVDPEIFDVLKVLIERQSLFKNKLEEKNISFIYPDNEYFVYADKNMVGLVIQNLIANAIKYCYKGGSIKVSVTDTNGQALISFEDSGVGIPEEKISQIFSDTFYTTKGTENEKGTGLGLMLCRDFVLKNNGEIWVESIEGKGSTFFFTLPHP